MTTIVLAFVAGGACGLVAMLAAAAIGHSRLREALYLARGKALRLAEQVDAREETIRMLAAERDRLVRRVGDLATRLNQRP